MLQEEVSEDNQALMSPSQVLQLKQAIVVLNLSTLKTPISDKVAVKVPPGQAYISPDTAQILKNHLEKTVFHQTSMVERLLFHQSTLSEVTMPTYGNSKKHQVRLETKLQMCLTDEKRREYDRGQVKEAKVDKGTLEKMSS